MPELLGVEAALLLDRPPASAEPLSARGISPPGVPGGMSMAVCRLAGPPPAAMLAVRLSICCNTSAQDILCGAGPDAKHSIIMPTAVMQEGMQAGIRLY